MTLIEFTEQRIAYHTYRSETETLSNAERHRLKREGKFTSLQIDNKADDVWQVREKGQPSKPSMLPNFDPQDNTLKEDWALAKHDEASSYAILSCSGRVIDVNQSYIILDCGTINVGHTYNVVANVYHKELSNYSHLSINERVDFKCFVGMFVTDHGGVIERCWSINWIGFLQDKRHTKIVVMCYGLPSWSKNKKGCLGGFLSLFE